MKRLIRQLATSPRRIARFYVDGFKEMTVGKKLWALIIIKLIIIFVVFKLFFFPDVLKENYDNDTERADAVRRSLTSERTPTPPPSTQHPIINL